MQPAANSEQMGDTPMHSDDEESKTDKRARVAREIFHNQQTQVKPLEGPEVSQSAGKNERKIAHYLKDELEPYWKYVDLEDPDNEDFFLIKGFLHSKHRNGSVYYEFDGRKHSENLAENILS